MPQERNVLTERFWTVRVIRDFWYKGVWRQTGEQFPVPPHVARGMIEAGNVLQVNWPKATTDIPWALQSVGPQSSPTGAGVSSLNGIEGDVNILAGPNITVTTGASSITIGAPNVVPTSRQVIAGAGLSGGGALTGNITLTANVLSVFGRTGAITAQAGDYNAGQITLSPAVSTWTTVQQAITALAATPPGLWQEAASPAGAIYYNGGRVGVGTATPAVTLDVVGPWATGIEGPAKITATGATCYLTLNTQATPGYSAVMFQVGSVYGAEIGYNSSDHTLQFWDKANQTVPTMTITTDGNVGIGLDSPTATLEVLGSDILAGGEPVGPFLVTAKEDWAYVTLDTTSSAATPYPFPGGGIIWWNRGKANNYALSAYLGEIDAWTNGIGGAPVMSFYVGEPDIQRMRISDRGHVVINSQIHDLHIPATGYPNAVLTVINDGSASSGPVPQGIDSIRFSDDDTAPIFFSWKTRGTEIAPTPVENGDWILFLGYGGLVSGFNGNQGAIAARVVTATGMADILFYTNDGTDNVGNGLERMRITHDGQVKVTGTYNGPAAWVSATAPASPQNGQLWWDSNNLRLMIWNGTWIQAG